MAVTTVAAAAAPYVIPIIASAVGGAASGSKSRGGGMPAQFPTPPVLSSGGGGRILSDAGRSASGELMELLKNTSKGIPTPPPLVSTPPFIPSQVANIPPDVIARLFGGYPIG